VPEGGPAREPAGYLRALGTSSGTGGQLAEAESVRGAEGAGEGPPGGRVERPPGATLSLRCVAACLEVVEGSQLWRSILAVYGSPRQACLWAERQFAGCVERQSDAPNILQSPEQIEFKRGGECRSWNEERVIKPQLHEKCRIVMYASMVTSFQICARGPCLFMPELQGFKRRSYKASPALLAI
jgi:hypothetical protein